MKLVTANVNNAPLAIQEEASWEELGIQFLSDEELALVSGGDHDSNNCQRGGDDDRYRDYESDYRRRCDDNDDDYDYSRHCHRHHHGRRCHR